MVLWNLQCLGFLEVARITYAYSILQLLQLAEAFLTAASGGTSNACPRADHHRHHLPGWMAWRCQVHADLVPGKDRMAMDGPRGPWAASEMIHETCWKFHIYVSLLENHQKTPGSFGKYENGETHALLQLDSVRRLHLLMVLGLFIPCPRLRPVFGSTCTSEASRRLNLVSTLPSEQPPWYGGSCRVPTISNQRHVGYQNDLHQNPASSAS